MRVSQKDPNQPTPRNRILILAGVGIVFFFLLMWLEGNRDYRSGESACDRARYKAKIEMERQIASGEKYGTEDSLARLRPYLIEVDAQCNQ